MTCEYWDYVWLNEGFATYLENKIADKVREAAKLIVEAILSPKHFWEFTALAEFAHIGLFCGEPNAQCDAARREAENTRHDETRRHHTRRHQYNL